MVKKNELEKAFENHKEHLSCNNVMKVPYEFRCEFVKATKSCQKYGLINYMQYVECGPRRSSHVEEILSCVGLILLFLLYLLFIAVVADQFYSPSLKALAKRMRLSEHLAGVTLLAFGNSLQHILSNINSIPMSTVFTYMLANAVLISLVGCGLICFLWPTQLPKYETVRTLLFFMLSAMSSEYMYLNDSSFSTLECFGIIFIYVVYLCIEIIEGYFEKKPVKGITILESRRRYTHQSNIPMHRITVSSVITRYRERNTINTNDTRFVHYRAGNSKNANLFENFVESIIPINEDFWRDCGLTFRCALIVLSPMTLFSLILIPMVDLERNRHGWSKLLNCAQIIITPMYSSIIVFGTSSTTIFYQLCITVPLAIIVFQSSRTDMPPSYHVGFVILSFIGSISLLYICTVEMDEILKVCARILGLSLDFVTATINCWGTSICTIVVNLILAQHGYAAMAIAASYAGPFFSSIMALGCLPLYRRITNSAESDSDLVVGSYYLVSFVFLMIALSSSFIWCLLFNFYGRRSIGIFNFMIYILYIIYCVLTEREFIHSYNMDSVLDIV